MPLVYLKEMFADRVAATKVYRKDLYQPSDALDYYLTREKNLSMHKITQETLKSWLIMLKEKGEKETFKYIRNFKEEDYGSHCS